MERPARLLVIAGRDPTGGAGVDADREAARAQGIEVLAVVTADTDQDGRRVRAVLPRPPETWAAEARDVLRLHPEVRVAKCGLLPGAEHVRALARLAAEHALWLVVDPVLAASGGETFLDEAGIAALVAELLPLGPVLTPNVPEAARLAALDPAELEAPEGRARAAERLLEAGAEAVVLKGGHLTEDPVRDLVLVRGGAPVWLERPRVRGRGASPGVGAALHGSGCRHASALAAGLALGLGVEEAARRAGDLLSELLRASGRPS